MLERKDVLSFDLRSSGRRVLAIRVAPSRRLLLGEFHSVVRCKCVCMDLFRQVFALWVNTVYTEFSHVRARSVDGEVPVGASVRFVQDRLKRARVRWFGTGV